MKLIVGLGNIGAQYEHTRHNVGFLVVNALASSHGSTWRQKDKFKAMVAEGVVGGQKILLAKPHTFYNLSGDAVQALAQFYKITTNDILVVHDELDLPFGVLRTRRGGSDAGNNGLKSIIAAVGVNIARLRIGIANEHTPSYDAADFVLSRFTSTEQQKLPDIKKHALQLLAAFIDESFDHTTTNV